MSRIPLVLGTTSDKKQHRNFAPPKVISSSNKTSSSTTTVNQDVDSAQDSFEVISRNVQQDTNARTKRSKHLFAEDKEAYSTRLTSKKRKNSDHSNHPVKFSSFRNPSSPLHDSAFKKITSHDVEGEGKQQIRLGSSYQNRNLFTSDHPNKIQQEIIDNSDMENKDRIQDDQDPKAMTMKFLAMSVPRGTLQEKNETIQPSSSVSNATPQRSAESIQQSQASTGPQFEIVNGQIVIKESSLVLGSEEIEEENEDEEQYEEVFETSDRVTSQSFTNRKRSEKWHPEETKLFYKCLRHVGMNFSLMENFFESRSRHELKVKFKYEERKNSRLVNMALSATKPIGSAVFKKLVKKIDSKGRSTKVT